MSLYQQFCDEVNKMINPKVIEVGTLRWGSDPTHHKASFPSSDYYMADIEHGKDVDIIVDLHSTNIQNQFDAFLACSVWEHLHSPWVAAENTLRMLKPGGLFFVQTHHTFPVHSYPMDMFRYTKEGLSWLFKRAGAEVIEAGYAFPAVITPPKEVTVWCNGAPAYLNVNVMGRKG